MPTRSEVLRARRRAVGGRRPRCRKGKSCSAACINQNKYCLVDAPTPVAGALPRAVKAIQTRGERLGRKEKKQVLEKRREFVKGKVRESAKLKKLRSEYRKKVNKFRIEFRKEIFNGEPMRLQELRSKLKSLEEGIGQRIGIAKSKALDEEEVKAGFRKARKSIIERLHGMYSGMSELASVNNKPLYEKEENEFFKLVKKSGRFLESDRSGLNSMALTLRGYQRGRFWNQAANERKNERLSKLNSVFNSLKNEAKKAAEEGDRSKYRDAENKLLKIAERAGNRIKISYRQTLPTKGSLWVDTRVPPVLKSLRDGMENALASGDLNKYKRLEDKFLKIKQNFEETGDKVERFNSLLRYGPRVSGVSTKGEVLRDYTDMLRNGMVDAANSRNRREYNNLENKLIRLSPDVEKGRIWKEKVEARVKEYVPRLRQGMRDAAINKDRKKYNKLERALLRLDPDATKGKIWREVRSRSYLPTLKMKLKEAAINGNRKEYNKLERVLFRMNRDNPSENIKGKVWRQERVGGAISKLAEDMEKAAREGDRAKYDRLEDRFFRIKNKVGNDAIRDIDLRYMSRGDVWREVERSKPLEGIQALLDKDKRKGVESIKVKGDQDDFSVVSRVLGNKVELKISPNDTTSFLVNDSYTASGTLSKREEFAITREVMRQYGEIVKQMPDGTVFYVTAASGDGREEMREQAYVKFGFSDPDYNGQMYGMVMRGKMTPIDGDDYRMAKAGGYDDDDYED